MFYIAFPHISFYILLPAPPMWVRGDWPYHSQFGCEKLERNEEPSLWSERHRLIPLTPACCVPCAHYLTTVHSRSSFLKWESNPVSIFGCSGGLHRKHLVQCWARSKHSTNVNYYSPCSRTCDYSICSYYETASLSTQARWGKPRSLPWAAAFWVFPPHLSIVHVFHVHWDLFTAITEYGLIWFFNCKANCLNPKHSANLFPTHEFYT